MTSRTADKQAFVETDVPSGVRSSIRVTRAIDFVLGSAALILLSPFMLLIAFAIGVVDGSPVMYRQKRTGRFGVEISVPKFRTMRAEPPDVPSRDDDAARVTTLGRVLRRTGLDESPQLLNVLTGSMSLVGPRPLLPRYMPWYTERELRRFLVRPGLTGLAQVEQRAGVDWDRKLELDVEFVDRYSIGLYLSVLARTPMALVHADQTAADERPLDVERRSLR